MDIRHPEIIMAAVTPVVVHPVVILLEVAVRKIATAKEMILQETTAAVVTEVTEAIAAEEVMEVPEVMVVVAIMTVLGTIIVAEVMVVLEIIAAAAVLIIPGIIGTVLIMAIRTPILMVQTIIAVRIIRELIIEVGMAIVPIRTWGLLPRNQVRRRKRKRAVWESRS